MKMKSTVLASMAVGLVASVSVAHAESATVSAMAPFNIAGELSAASEKDMIFLGRLDGVFYYESENRALDAAPMSCPITVRMSGVTGAYVLRADCRFAPADGSGVAYAGMLCEGSLGDGCSGEMTFKDGSGRFEGITGSGEMALRSPLAGMGLSENAGSVDVAVTGLAVWPELLIDLPE